MQTHFWGMVRLFCLCSLEYLQYLLRYLEFPLLLPCKYTSLGISERIPFSVEASKASSALPFDRLLARDFYFVFEVGDYHALTNIGLVLLKELHRRYYDV